MRYTTRTKLFVDSAFWIAFFDRSDSNHRKAKSLAQQNLNSYLPFSTSDYVLDECLTRIKRKVNTEASFLFYNLILEKIRRNSLNVLQTTKEVFDKAYKIFKNNPTSKSFSFTDASIVALMKVHQIRSLLTFDQDFKKIKPKVQVLP